MGVYKVKGKKGESWGIDFYDNGRRIKKIIGSKQDAEHSLHLLKADSLRGELQMIRKSDMSFEELCEKYLEYGETNGKRSLERDEYSIKALMSSFEHLKITQINPLMIEDYKKKRQDERKKSATINRELSCLRHMFNLARKWKIIRESPMDEVKLLKEGKYKMRILDKVEADLLIDAAADHLKPILIVALNTGMRRGEVLGLRWSDIDFVNYNIHVKNTKSGKDRDVPMNELVAATFKKQDMSCEWIFPHPQGKDRAIKDVTHSFKTACKKCGIEKLRFHDLRHTAATFMVQAGADLVTIKEILGHSTVQMTMVYCHSSQESKRKAVQKLEEIFSVPSIVQNFMGRNREEKPKKDDSAPL